MYKDLEYVVQSQQHMSQHFSNNNQSNSAVLLI